MQVRALFGRPTVRLLALTAGFAALALSPASAQRPDIVWMRGSHHAGPNLFDFFPDSQRFITGGDDCTLKIFRVSDGNLLRTIPVDRRIWRASEMGKLSPDGSKLALYTEFASFGSPGMSVWDIATGTQVWPTSSAAGAVWAPRWSGDSTLFGNGRYVVDAATGAIAWDPGRSYSDMARDGQSVVTEGYMVLRSDPQHPIPWGNGLENPIFSPDYTTAGGGAIAAVESTWVPSVQGWAQNAYCSFGRFPAEAAGAASYSRLLWPKTDDGSHYFFGALRTTGSYVHLLSFDTRTLQKRTLASFTPETAGEGPPFVTLGATRDGQLAGFARAGRSIQAEGPVKIVRVSDGVPEADYTSHVGAVMGSAYSAQPVTVGPGEKAHIVASVSYDGTARIWNAATGAHISTTRLPPLKDYYGMGGIALSPDGRTMAAAFSHTVTIYDISNVRAPALLVTWEATSTYPPAFSPDGQFLAFTVHYWQAWGHSMFLILYQKQGSTWVGKGQVLLGEDPYDSRPACAFSPDSKTLVAASGYVRRFRVPDLALLGSAIPRGYGPFGIAYSADGKRIALATADGAAILDAITLQVVWGDPPQTGVIPSIAIDPCNETFIYGIQPTAALSPGKIRIRKLSTGALLKTYDQETGMTHDLPTSDTITLASFSYSPDGQFITYARNDSSMAVIKNPAWTPPKLAGLGASPASAAGGGAVTGTVTLDCPALIGGCEVTLGTGNPALATVPSTVTIPVGKKSATFPITTYGVTSPQTVSISAAYRGVTKTKTITIGPPALASVDVTPASVIAGAPATVTVTLTGTPATGSGGITVNLASSGAAASVPVTLIVPEGSTTATAQAATWGVASITTVTVTASLNGNTKSDTLTVKPAVLSALSLSPTSVKGGAQTSTGTVRLTGLAPAGGLTVNLSSSHPAAQPPATVTVPEGQSTASFTIPTSAVTAKVAAKITAVAGSVTKAATLTVTP